MPDLWELSAEETAARVRRREVSAAEVLEACLARTAQVEPLIGAYLEIFESDGVCAPAFPGETAGGPIVFLVIHMEYAAIKRSLLHLDGVRFDEIRAGFIPAELNQLFGRFSRPARDRAERGQKAKRQKKSGSAHSSR